MIDQHWKDIEARASGLSTDIREKPVLKVLMDLNIRLADMECVLKACCAKGLAAGLSTHARDNPTTADTAALSGMGYF